MVSVTTFTQVTTEAVVPRAAEPSDIVGLTLQNAGATALAAQDISFNEVFLPGELAAGAGLVAVVDGQSEAVQVDPKTFNADGSVASAVIELLQPALAAGASAGVMLAQAPAEAPAPGPAIDLAAASASHSLSVTLQFQNADGSITPYSVDLLAVLRTDLGNGTASYWQQGGLATQARIDIPIAGSYHLVADITATADGNLLADVQFDNDLAEGATGGAVTLASAVITLDGVATTAATNLLQYQYEDFDTTVGTGDAAAVNVQHDIAALESTGAIANFDTSVGVDASWMTVEASAEAGAGWNAPLATDGITQYMPGTGGRPDIGPTTQGNAAWLLTQNATAEQYALGQANAAAGIPWHYAYDGGWLDTTYATNVWTDGRGGPGSYSTGLTQQVDAANNGWTTDQAHQPDLDYDAYVLTGNRFYLDQLNAQAAFDVTEEWPGDFAFQADGTETGNARLVAGLDDNVINGSQIRGAAWNMRQIDEAAWANPAGSAEGQYFTQVASDNWSWLVAQLPSWTAEEGQVHGWIPGGYAAGCLSPWQQDYFASTAIAAAEQGNADALTYLNWAENFLVGRFLNAANGFDPNNGVSYELGYETDGGAVQTAPTIWAQMQADTAALGQDNGAGWDHSDGDYPMLGLQTLAGYITLTGSTDAMRAYGWLLGSGAPFLDLATLQDNSQFAIAPRLADGALLTRDEVTVTDDTTATTLSTSGAHAMVVETGTGDVTIQGGAAIDILFAGAGNDVLLGGSGTDSLFGGTGAVTLAGGAGTNVLETGTGAATIVLAAADVASDTIIGFRPGTDTLLISDAGCQPIDAAEAAAIVAAATSDAAGDVVIALSASHSVTLSGLGLGDLAGLLGVAGAPGAVTAPVQPTPPDAGTTASGPPDAGAASAGTTGIGAAEAGAGETSVTGAGTADTSASQPPLPTTTTALAGASTTLSPLDLSAYGAAAASTVTDALAALGGIPSIVTVGGAALPPAVAGSTSFAVLSPAADANLALPDGYAGAMLLGNTDATLSDGGHAGVLLVGNAGADVLRATADGDTLVGGAGNTVFSAPESATVVTGAGENTVVSTGEGNHVITTGAGHASVALGSGQDVVTTQGTDTVTAGSGTAVIYASGPTAVYGGSQGSSTTLVSGNAPSMAVGGAGGLVVFGSSADGGVVYGGSGATSFVGGTGSATVVGGAGSLLAFGGSGGGAMFGGTGPSAIYTAEGANTVVVAGTGASTITAGGGTTAFLTGAASTLFVAGAGNVTLVGGAGSGADTIFAGAGEDVLSGGTGDDLLTAGTGSATLAGGGGENTYLFVDGQAGGTDTITDFAAGRDHISLAGYGGDAVAQALSSASVGGGSTVLTLQDATRVVLEGVTALDRNAFT